MVSMRPVAMRLFDRGNLSTSLHGHLHCHVHCQKATPEPTPKQGTPKRKTLRPNADWI
jgi:hypothetical protein